MERFLLLTFMIGITSTGAIAAAPNGQARSAAQPAAKSTDSGEQHQIYGTIRSIEGSQLTIETRDKRMVKVDATTAIKSYRTVVLVVGNTVNVGGPYDAKGVLHAETIQRAKSSPAIWPADR
jgi:hypothetical protein